MPAYIVSALTPRDPDAFQDYRTRAAAAIAAFGGRYLVRGGEMTVLEGDAISPSLVVVEFPDMETAKRWYASPEYAAALAFRDRGLERDLMLVEGVEPPARS